MEKMSEVGIAPVTLDCDIRDVCRRHGISDATFYTWRKRYGSLGVSEVRWLKEPEEENRRLKRMVADQAVDHAATPLDLAASWSTPIHEESPQLRLWAPRVFVVSGGHNGL